MSKSLGDQQHAAISHPYEREAVALLYRAGWSISELSMVFETGDGAVRRLLAAEGVQTDE